MLHKLEHELLNHPIVQFWLKNLKPHNPAKHCSMEHGSFDFCLENAVLKIVQLGLHGGIPSVANALDYYIIKMKNQPLEKPYRGNWDLTFIANFLYIVGINDDYLTKIMTYNLDELFSFIQLKIYDIYLNEEERSKLKNVPQQWKEKKFIKPELLRKYSMCYPLIYDIISLHRLYELNNLDINNKINAVIEYISTDEFHNIIADGYGICPEADGKTYHSMGWDPKYPGWFGVEEYMENYTQRQKLNSDRGAGILFFAQNIAKYPTATKTKWFNDLLNCLEKYKTANNTYIFPKELLLEKVGYAVGGCHMGLGENRRKKNWLEIESTFYMQLMRQHV